MDLGRLAYWEAGYRFQTDPDGGVADLAARDALGRSLGNTLVGLSVENAFNTTALDMVSQSAGAFSAAANADIAYLTDTSQVSAAFATAMNGESGMLQHLLDRYRDPSTRGEVIANFQLNGVTEEQLAEVMAKQQQIDKAISGTLLQPDAEFHAWAAGIQAQESNGANPLEATLISESLSAMAGIRSHARQDLVERTMVVAGFAILADDWGQFRSIIDPSTGKPFIYTTTANGFDLSSPILTGKKPLALSFSTPKP